jgi:glycosyltransferase involved in cell wall biosynthesis
MRLVGPDEEGHRAELIEKVAKAGLSEDWSFEDGLEGEGKWSAMAEADLFILASHSENFGIVVAEALASGTPVITTTGTPWQKIVENGCGWWVDATAAALAGALAEACAITDEERSSMGSRGRDWIAADFGWGGIAENIELFYRDLLASS